MSLISKERQAAAAAATRERARQAAQQIAPAARSARDNATRGVHGARAWAAPRIEHAAQTLQENVAPKVSAALEATAHRIEPAPAQVKELGRRTRRRAQAASREVSQRRGKVLARSAKPAARWPRVAGGVAFVVAAFGAAGAVVMRRNRHLPDPMEETVVVTGETDQDTASAEPDGQVRTP